MVYAGAGSHASYFAAGEYQAEVPLPVPEAVRQGLDVLSRFWRQTLGQGSTTEAPFRAPFIDFARGDGLSVGPGQEREWTPRQISEATPWASAYRGLWGLYAQDPISGENAPGGPMYNRDGSPPSRPARIRLPLNPLSYEIQRTTTSNSSGGGNPLGGILS